MSSVLDEYRIEEKRRDDVEKEFDFCCDFGAECSYIVYFHAFILEYGCFCR